MRARSSGTRRPSSIIASGGAAAAGAACRVAAALLRALLAVQHVGARDVVLAGAHQRQFDLVLDVFDVEGAAVRLAAHQRSRPRCR